MAATKPSSENLIPTDNEFTSVIGFSRVSIGKPFKTYKEIISYQLADEVYGMDKGKPIVHPSIKTALDASGDDNLLLKSKLGKKNRDTTLGGNEAINCYWQFNENDDIMADYTAIDEDNGIGMGRVYSETFDDKQQIMYLTMGVPEFANLTSFYANAVDSSIAKLVNNGDYSIIESIFAMAGLTIGFLIALPVLPLVFLHKIFSDITRSNAARYYDFRATMPLYYKTVNTMLAHLGVNMGLIGMQTKGNTDKVEKAQDDNNTGGLTDLIKETNLDILQILMRKDILDSNPNVPKSPDHRSLNYQINKLKDDKNVSKPKNYNKKENKATSEDNNSWFGNMLSGFSKGFNYGTMDSLNFIGLKIEKSTDVSESASNSTGEMSIASTVNSKASSSIQDKASSGGNSALGKVFSTLTGSFEKMIGNVIGEAGSFFGIGAAEVLKGNGVIDFPEIWTGSSFSRSSYNFTMQLRAPCADKVSIFYYIYIPLSMILCAALPRAVGKNSYTSPFIVRAYSKGMFAVPMGIIDNISIKRGAPEFGWNVDNFPTCVDVSFSIKDLSPAMYVPVAESKNFLDILAPDNTYQEYLLTLTGTTIRDRILFKKRVERNYFTFLNVIKNNKFNPMMWGFTEANKGVGRLVSALRPTSRIPKKIVTHQGVKL